MLFFAGAKIFACTNMAQTVIQMPYHRLTLNCSPRSYFRHDKDLSVFFQSWYQLCYNQIAVPTCLLSLKRCFKGKLQLAGWSTSQILD